MKWNEAEQLTRPLLEGVRRGRVPASEPGVELATLDWGGDGDLLVIHHANGFCAGVYAPIAARLRDRFRVVAIDARGHGDSTPVDADANPEAYDWNTLAADYAAAHVHLVESLGRSGIRLAVGHSFGGVLTLAAAASHPGLVEETLLLDPVVVPPAHLMPPTSEQSPPTNPGPSLSVTARRRRAVFASREEAFGHFEGRGIFENFRPEALALYVAEGMRETSDGEVRLKCEPAVEATIFGSAPSLDIFGIAPKIEARTRFIHAGRGHFSKEVYASLASQMPDARVESRDADHLLAMEDPELVVGCVLGE